MRTVKFIFSGSNSTIVNEDVCAQEGTYDLTEILSVYVRDPDLITTATASAIHRSYASTLVVPGPSKLMNVLRSGWLSRQNICRESFQSITFIRGDDSP